MTERNFWISWYCPAALGAWELASPWWVSGYAMSDDEDVLCIVAAVHATDEEAAKEVVLAAYDTRPASMEWRFVSEREADWSPFCDRFPKADWMVWP